MRLLVSVRAAAEVPPALAGGADIIDAKEPARGSLGAVDPEVLRAIAAVVPPTVPLSVALGDFAAVAVAADAVRQAVGVLDACPRRAPLYLKLGFAGQRSPTVVTRTIGAALEVTGAVSVRAVVVPVAYADHERAGSPEPEEVLNAAIEAGAQAFLVDTWAKAGGGLLSCIDAHGLRSLADAARSAGMLVAIAGSLDADTLDRLDRIADVVGVRGAACRGGREGSVDAALVRHLAEQVRVRSHPVAPAR
ncbi:MAG TPA: (5-formylfuran-3-yl)methyl phosphate synthase [Gemmatimonadales bacterium]|nr:(5-formylfuran-3-yl)methyl phosphate synthase [Gemmatimonadales bacterium]